MGKLFDELKRRKVVRVAGVYAVVAWLLIQVANNIVPALQLPAWTNTLLVVMLLFGFPVALVLAWAYEVTPEGIRADSSNQIAGAGVATPANDQKLIYATFALVLLVAGFQIADRFLAPAQRSSGDLSVPENAAAASNGAGLALPETRLDIVTPATSLPTDFALSPDGRQIVFVASDDDGVAQLWLRSLAATAARPLTGTEGAQQPFWSPDSRSIGFFAGSALKRLDLSGGAPQILATVGVPSGGAWGDNNILLFKSSSDPSLMRVSATGGEVTPATTREPGQLIHSAPSFLPDGRRFLFFAVGTPETVGMYLGDLDGSAPVRLSDSVSPGVYHPAGWLLWLRAGALVAQRLDPEQATLTGELVTVADEVAEDRSARLSGLSVSSTGLIAYRTGVARQRQLTWFDRAGITLGTLGEPDDTISAPRVSPDGRRVAVFRFVSGDTDIWLLDGARNTRFTFSVGADVVPEWSPDGSWIVYRSARTGGGDLYRKPSNGAGEETLLFSSDQLKTPNNWSADGRFLLYHTTSLETARDLWALPMTGEAAPFIVLQTPFNESRAALSPDGRWVAYHSDASGQNEVYVRAFGEPVDNGAGAVNAMSGVWQVSIAGGVYAAWSPEGQELYYLDPAGNMRAAPFTVTAGSVEVGDPEVLFPTRILGGGTETGQGKQYDVAAEGRFLINTLVGEVSTAPITLIQNWNPEAAQ